MDSGAIGVSGGLGQTPAGLGMDAVGGQSGPEFQMPDAPNWRDQIVVWRQDDAPNRYLSISAEPLCDDGAAAGLARLRH